MTFCNCYSQSCLRSTVLCFFITQDTNIICRRLILLRLLVTLRHPNTVLISVRPKYIIPYFYNMKGFRVCFRLLVTLRLLNTVFLSVRAQIFHGKLYILIIWKVYSVIQVVCYVLRKPNTVLVFVRLKYFTLNFVFSLFEYFQFGSGNVLRYSIYILFLFLWDSNIASQTLSFQLFLDYHAVRPLTGLIYTIAAMRYVTASDYWLLFISSHRHKFNIHV